MRRELFWLYDQVASCTSFYSAFGDIVLLYPAYKVPLNSTPGPSSRTQAQTHHTFLLSRLLMLIQEQMFPLLSPTNFTVPLFSSTSRTSSKANHTKSMSDSSSTYTTKPLLKETESQNGSPTKSRDKSSAGRAPLVYISWQS